MVTWHDRSPRTGRLVKGGAPLEALARAHTVLARIVEDLPLEKIDRYLIRDAQRVTEAIEALVRIHTAQEQDIYDAVVAR